MAGDLRPRISAASESGDTLPSHRLAETSSGRPVAWLAYGSTCGRSPGRWREAVTDRLRPNTPGQARARTGTDEARPGNRLIARPTSSTVTARIDLAQPR